MAAGLGRWGGAAPSPGGESLSAPLGGSRAGGALGAPSLSYSSQRAASQAEGKWHSGRANSALSLPKQAKIPFCMCVAQLHHASVLFASAHPSKPIWGNGASVILRHGEELRQLSLLTSTWVCISSISFLYKQPQECILLLFI